ncbi:AraC family transcriptional regulator [Martelella mediterranea]|uniref:helix-turn-helix transcriptional regulator n=1 Tax=Martelella mediterranea TaxID=293089 RepID=UPI001E3DB518|nr:AraC family transcriptional regulator [Martelella mediterranea]MCD1634208.1 AraC family transcriptional regulator [Martelella mediterranea]
MPDSHAGRIARAVDILRREYTRPIRVEELAEAAAMREPAFHKHFRAITTLSPLQFQKQLRLIEARRLMLLEGTKIAEAAHAVGYASVTQFTREYGRLFNVPPGRDIRIENAVA